MSRKFIIILISSVLGLLLLSLVGYYFIIQGNSGTNTGGIVSTFRSFLPFSGDNVVPNETSTSTPEDNIAPEQPATSNFTQKLRKISTEPVSGAGTLDIKAGTVVRYIEKATGHIFETEMFSPKQTRISNTTIPLVYDALWGSGANSLLTRYLGDDDFTVNTYTLLLKNIASSSVPTENTLSGISFPGGISDVAVYGNSVFYLQQSSTFAQGYVSNFDGSKKKLIWSSEIKELNPQFVNDKTVALTTKPYPFVNGYLYFVDTGTGATKRVLGNIQGLSSLVSPDAKFILYLEQKSGVTLSLYDISKKTNTLIYPATFPEKCVWSKKDVSIVYCAGPKNTLSNSSLTNWYQGQIYMTDDIWKYNLKDNTSTILEDLSADSGEQIDVVKPILSENEQYLVFINKIDNSLWTLDLTK